MVKFYQLENKSEAAAAATNHEVSEHGSRRCPATASEEARQEQKEVDHVCVILRRSRLAVLKLAGMFGWSGLETL